MFETIKAIIGDIAAGAIKDQRIALSQEQLAAVDLKLREALSENKGLRERVSALEQLVRGQDAQMKKLTAATQAQRTADLPEIEERILLTLASVEFMTEDAIAERLAVGHHVADHHLETLETAEMIWAEKVTYGAPRRWRLMSLGRDYLIERELLK